MHPLYTFDGIDPRAFDMTAWFNLVGALGCIFWIVAYAFAVRTAKRDQANAIPLVAVALNFSWELLASFAFPNPVKLWHAFDRIWLVVDVIIVVQTLSYGPAMARVAAVAQRYMLVFATIFVMGLVGQYTFVADYTDRLGLVAAFVINLVMSIAFVTMYFDRPDRRGISRGVAWFKMLGTAGTSIECHVVVRLVDPELGGLGFLTFVTVSIFLIDCFYIVLVSRKPAA
jgi:hypothetical protein